MGAKSKKKSKRAPAQQAASPKTGETPESPSAPGGLGYPLVVIGASAGGLDAFSTLLRHLPEDTGMAFVLVQHLDPTKESILDELLQKATRLPVRKIEKDLHLAPNTVFVVPPEGHIDLKGTVFEVTPRIKGVHGGTPIDSFFRSVAEQFRSRVIGVVLSGTLSDGALGLTAIKAEGGVTFAQDAASAAFSEMPRAAAMAGAADFVLPPDRIAKEIARISHHPYVRQEPSVEEAAAAEFKDASAGRKLLQLLRAGTGVDFTNYRQSTFRRRVQRRMALKRTTTLARYVDYVRSNPEEIKSLFDDILITVTRFFRDPEVFEALRTRVFRDMVKNRPRDSAIRIWVPGCATGEEVYSIGIVLLEALEDVESAVPVQIFATDISDRALERARAGEYLESAVRDVTPDRLKRFFVRTPAGYQISKSVRDLCIFARQNVTADPPFSGLDLLSCRNLLIYLDPHLQERIFPAFHYALKRGGFLLLGRSESLGKFAEHFHPFDRNNRIFQKADGRIALPRDVVLPSVLPRSPARPSEPAPLQPPLSKIDVSHLADRVVLSRYGPAGVLLNELYEIVQFRGRTAPYLEPSSGAATLNVFKMAREGLLGPLRTAVLKARKSGERVRREGVKVRDNGKLRSVHVEVTPIRQGVNGQTYFLVLFEDSRSAAFAQQAAPGPPLKGSKAVATIHTLEQELGTTKEYLQAIIEEQEASNEELKSANEEILSANEELQSTNEELETAKEELQSTNEELTTVNEELQNRNAELAYAHNDLVNIFGINLPIVMVAANGTIRRVTPPAERIFNLGPRDIGRNITEFRPRLRNVDLAELIEHVSDSLGTIDREVQDETGNWYSLRIRPYKTIDNRIDGTIIALFDLRSTEQITRSRDYADAVLETVREALVILDEELRIRSANKGFYSRVRMAPSQVEGKSISDLWKLQERAPELQYFLERALTERDPIVNYELEIDLGAPGRRSLLVNARRLQPAGEPKPYILMAFDDITERKWIEQGLRASELRYRLLFETAREGIWLLDGESGKVLDANPFLLDLLGLRKEELIGREPWDLYAEPKAAIRRFEDLKKRGFSYDPELTMRSKSGNEVRIEAVSNLYTVGVSRVLQCNMRDLTDRSRLEEQVRQMQKLESIGNLAGGVAHDFNNILNIISAHTAVLGRKTADGNGNRQKESAQAIEQAVQRGAGVVKQLLTFARRTETAFYPVDVNPIADEVRKMVVETFPKTVELRAELAPDLPKILGNPTQIHQALLNLVVNARDAMQKGGTITLRTRAVPGERLRRRLESATAEEYVSIEVADEGPGMSEEVRKRLFEPFFTTKEKGKGIGMGLAVVYGVVQAHQGTIDVESEPGKGTCFSLYFPAASLAAESAGAESSAELAPEEPANDAEASWGSEEDGDGDGKGRTILFVEDEELLQSAIRSLLEDQGYRVLTARDGIEAVEVHAARKKEIDAVIVDLGLPKLDGWDAFQQMKKADPKLKAIIASGTLDAEKRSRMRRAGIRATLRKPYGPREILAALRQVLED